MRLADRCYEVGVESDLDDDRTGTHPLAAADLVDAYRGKQRPLYPASPARHALAVLLAALDSARTKRVAEIQPPTRNSPCCISVCDR